MPGVLVVMGSGETSPTMVKTHRAVLDRVGRPAVMLDTPFGFQENADELTAKAVGYFRDSVGVDLGVARLRSAEAPAVEREAAYASLRSARFVFAGPGSPTYALRQWAATPVPALLAEVLHRGGAVVFASAAALTLGRFTVPVYEIYKVGAQVAWCDGLDVLAEAGLQAAVVPHWNNAEGGTHDTRYAYLGERRLRILEDQLPDGCFVLGVDEHTALVIDLAAGRASVEGLGTVTVRSHGHAEVFASGTSVPIGALAEAASAAGARAPARPGPPRQPPPPAPPASPLLGDVARLEAAFGAALEARDVRAALGALLELDELLAAWSSETFSGDEMAQARRAFRAMLVRLGELAAEGARDPRETVAPFVDALLAARAERRRARDYATADALRDRLLAAGVTLRDTPAGTEWDLA